MNIDTIQLITILVTVVGGLKAIEWVVKKITDSHDEKKQIGTNKENFDEYKKQTDKEIADLKSKLASAHTYTQERLDNLKEDILGTINDDRAEYLKGIEEVKQSLTEMSSVYQQTMAIVELKIDNMEKSNKERLAELKRTQEKHNNLMERTFINEREISVLQNRESVSEHRISDLESKKNG